MTNIMIQEKQGEPAACFIIICFETLREINSGLQYGGDNVTETQWSELQRETGDAYINQRTLDVRINI